MKDGDLMEYIYESERIGFIKLDEKIQQKIFKKIYNEEQISNWVKS